MLTCGEGAEVDVNTDSMAFPSTGCSAWDTFLVPTACGADAQLQQALDGCIS